MTVSEKFVKYFKLLLFMIITTIVLSKAVVSLFIAYNLISVQSLTMLLPITKVGFFKLEYLFRVGLAFSDLSFNLKTPVNLLSLFDVLPILSIILFLEVNRITTKSSKILFSLLSLLIIYIFKYLGLFATLLRAISLNYNFNFILGLNYLGYLLLFIALSQITAVSFLAYGYYKDIKIVKVE